MLNRYRPKPFLQLLALRLISVRTNAFCATEKVIGPVTAHHYLASIKVRTLQNVTVAAALDTLLDSVQIVALIKLASTDASLVLASRKGIKTKCRLRRATLDRDSGISSSAGTVYFGPVAPSPVIFPPRFFQAYDNGYYERYIQHAVKAKF